MTNNIFNGNRYMMKNEGLEIFFCDWYRYLYNMDIGSDTNMANFDRHHSGVHPLIKLTNVEVLCCIVTIYYHVLWQYWMRNLSRTP